MTDFTIKEVRRILQKVAWNDRNICWEWLGSRGEDGYGRIWLRDHPKAMAHRAVYELLVGEIFPGLQIDHLCRNHGCVNPSHLEPVTQRENLLRGNTIVAIQSRQEACGRGHPFDRENTYLHEGHRLCRACRRDYQFKRYWAKKFGN